MYRLRLNSEVRSILAAILVTLLLGWALKEVMTPKAFAQGEYVPPDRGIPGRRESGGVRYQSGEPTLLTMGYQPK